MFEPMAKADRIQFGPGAVLRLRFADQFEGHGDILQGGHGWQQVKRLQDDPHPTAAQPGERILIEFAHVGSQQHRLARLSALQACRHRQQRALARP